MTKRAHGGRALLVDGHSLVYRAFFALPPLSGGGVPTGAVHGFLNMLRRLIDTERPTHVAVAFDRGRPQFRIDALPQYKAQREAAPDDLRSQVLLLADLLPKMHVPVVICPGFEGDDILGTLSDQLSAAGGEVLLVSGDKDILQLVGPTVTVLLTKRGITDLARYGPAEVEAEYGVVPSRVPEYKALAGDSSDNLPGVSGIGPKGARALLSGVDSLEELIAGGGTATPRQRLAITGAADGVLSQRMVATIRRDAPVDVAEAALRYAPGVDPDAREALTRLEMRGLLARWAGDQTTLAAPPPAAAVPARAVGPAVSAPSDATGLALVVEGPPGARRAVRAAIADDGGVRALPVAEDGGAPNAVLAALAGASPVAGYGLKEACALAQRAGVRVCAPLWDLAVATYLAEPGRTRYTPEGLAGELSVPTPDPEDPAAMASFARLAHTATRERLARDGMAALADEVEMPLMPVLAEMEERGLRVEPRELVAMDGELAARLAALEAQITLEAKGPFNLNSPRQLADVLFGRLGLPVGKRTKTGPSTDQEVLSELEGRHPIIGLVLEHRQLGKLRATYVQGLLAIVGGGAERIHTTFHQTVAATGRLSSADPNLQNIPVRLEEGRRIRRAFVASPGHLLVSADYSQIELRVLAHLSGDPALRAAFAAGEDVHRATAAAVFGVAPDAVTPEMRRRAKAVNFGIVYGISDFGLGRDLGIPVGEARAFIEAYFSRHPGVRRYLDEAVAAARERGYARTIMGRRRYLPDLASRQRPARAFAERNAMNSPIQGTAADIIKAAMVALGPDPGPSGERLVLQVHDELIVEVPEAGVRTAARRLRDAMAKAVILDVPLVVDLKVGRTWYDVRPWVEDPPGEASAGA